MMRTLGASSTIATQAVSAGVAKPLNRPNPMQFYFFFHMTNPAADQNLQLEGRTVMELSPASSLPDSVGPVKLRGLDLRRTTSSLEAQETCSRDPLNFISWARRGSDIWF